MTRRILIVDDHAGFRRSASRSLAAAGWEVVGEADGGEAALEAAERCEPTWSFSTSASPTSAGSR